MTLAAKTPQVDIQPKIKSHFATIPPAPASLSHLTIFCLIFGLYLTLRGYHAFDGDQAYRIPLLLHRQDPSLYATDPFVRAFDDFNPHRGYLTLLDGASRPFGLALALFAIFGLTFGLTAGGINRLARSVWPDSTGRVGLVAVVLVLAAKAGNVGTNHLFEATLLDRLLGFALGWVALASSLENPRRGLWIGPICLGTASLVHPSVGLQLALTLAATWGVWGLFGGCAEVSIGKAGTAIGAIGLALTPGLFLMASQSPQLFKGLSPQEFRLLAVMIQSPQHMLPSTWRTPQWLAWGCYPVLTFLALGRVGLARSGVAWSARQVRFAALVAVNLVSLGLAYLAVEVLGDLRVTVFQPFRMATLARGLALVAISGRILDLWNRGDFASRSRAVLVGVGLGGDWAMVVATIVELSMSAVEWAQIRRWGQNSEWGARLAGLAVLTLGVIFLAKHDTESGHLALMGGLGALGLWSLLAYCVALTWTPRRVRLAMVAAWALPVAALITPWVVKDVGAQGWSAGLVERCRFSEVPTDDLERLALWCRDNTPQDSRFIGPPGPKTFRLWSRRSLAFNRAGSPYHAKGLVDWASRYRAHVGFEGSTTEFAAAYLNDRHALEAKYGRMTDAELVKLARSQGASYILVSSSRPTGDPSGLLRRIKVEGRYAIERILPERWICLTTKLRKKFAEIPFQFDLND